MLAEIRGSCKQNREFANIAQKCFQNLANKKSVWSLCKVVQMKKTSHKVRGVLLREGLYKAFASCLSSAAVSGFLSSSSQAENGNGQVRQQDDEACITFITFSDGSIRSFRLCIFNRVRSLG